MTEDTVVTDLTEDTVVSDLTDDEKHDSSLADIAVNHFATAESIEDAGEWANNDAIHADNAGNQFTTSEIIISNERVSDDMIIIKTHVSKLKVVSHIFGKLITIKFYIID